MTETSLVPTVQRATRERKVEGIQAGTLRCLTWVPSKDRPYLNLYDSKTLPLGMFRLTGLGRLYVLALPHSIACRYMPWAYNLHCLPRKRANTLAERTNIYTPLGHLTASFTFYCCGIAEGPGT